MKSKISKLKDGEQFYLSPRKKTLDRLDTFEKSQAVITSISSGRKFHKPKKSICYVPDLRQESSYAEDGL